jgi:hypothetical protein
VSRGPGQGKYATIEALAEATDFEKHGIIVPGFEIFRKCPDLDTNEGMVNYKDTHIYLPADFDLRLVEGTKPIDAGCRLRGVNDDHTGEAPDLGAYELSRSVPHYGPRGQATNARVLSHQWANPR